MSHVYTAHFRVRYYECDGYRHLNNANYLRYMEQTAIEASTALGFDHDHYVAQGTLWIIHESDIEYFLPLAPGDEVRITTSMTDFRRVRGWRQYEFTRVSDGARIASAQSGWVYVDSKSGRPTNVPQAIIDASYPGFTPGQTANAAKPLIIPPPPPRPYVMTRRAEWRDIDMAGHVNNANYLSYMEECAIQSLEAFGWSMERLIAAGIGIVARRHHIVYEQPAVIGDTLEITTFLAEVGRTSAVRYFTVTRPADGAPIARARTAWVFIDLTTGRPTRVPEDLMTAFADHIVR